MRSNFDDGLNLKADGRGLEACGRLDWTSPDGPQGADKVTVTAKVTDQNGVMAEGTSDECGNSVTEWMVHLRPGPGQKFQPGPAQASGTLTVTHPPPASTGSATFTWQQSVQLQFP